MRHLFLVILFLYSIMAWPQDQPKEVKQLEIFDLLVSKEKREKRSRDTIVVKPKKLYFSILPFIGYNPAMGMLAGITLNPAIYLGHPSHTPISSFIINASVTTQQQVLLNIKSSIFTSRASFILQGDWRLYLYNQPTYGLGSQIQRSDTSYFSVQTGDIGYSVSNQAYPMFFDYLRIYQTINRQVIDRFYLGLGYQLDYHFNIKDERLQLDTLPYTYTEHYTYSVRNNFNTEEYTRSGLVLSLLYDSRDNSIRPTRGYYARLYPIFNATWLGSSRNSIVLTSEFRTYISLSKSNPAHLLAFWYLGVFRLAGEVPYLELPAIGWDTYNRTGRGYVQGRIRGVNFVYGEAEYRFPISRYTRILSGVVFLNATTADNDTNIPLFRYFAPAGGVGLRIMFNKTTLSNLTIDFGMGQAGSSGIFFNLTETF